MTAADWEAYAEASAYGDTVACHDIADRENAARWYGAARSDERSAQRAQSDTPMRHKDKRASTRKLERLAARSDAHAATRRSLARMATASWL